MENIELLQKMKYINSFYIRKKTLIVSSFRLDCEEKQHEYDEQIKLMKKLEMSIGNEGVHYQQLIKRYYELCDELTNAQNALKRLKQQRDQIPM